MRTTDTTLEPSAIPADFEVQPISPDDPAATDPATCGTCGLTWDDAKPTSWTPAPSGRCPFEYFHPEPEEDEGSPLATPANMRRYAQDDKRIEGPGGTIVIHARQPIAYSPTTGETCSATAGDYWTLPDNEPLRDSEGEPMILAFETHGYEDMNGEPV